MRYATLYRYSLPMDSGVILRQAHLTRREGLVIALCVNNKTALGEIAPLKGFSTENLASAVEQTQQVLLQWTQGEKIDLNCLYPSVAFGLSIALHELNNTLPKEGNFQAVPLCHGDPNELIEKLALMQGQKVAKIKVGMFEAIRDGITINMLLEAISDLQLRLDANQRWDLAKALKFASFITPCLRSRISFIEEPCQTMAQSLRFSLLTGIAIAWDETSRLAHFQLQKAQGLKAVIVKPSLVGSVDKVTALVNDIHQLGLQAVISSSLESSLGLYHLARLANFLTPNTPPGLDTVTLFKMQLEIPWQGCTLPVQTLSECDLLWQSQ